MQIDSFLSLYKGQVQVHQGPPHKTRYTELIGEKGDKSLKHMSTAENFLNRAPITYALRSRIDKWDLIILQKFCKTKETVDRTK